VNGANGTSGTSGVNGANGTSGTSGVNGANGTSGTSGTSGVNGANGTSGTSGANGANGTSGTSGVNGANGTSGVNGTSGTSGTRGTSGVNGANGTSGVNGANGTSGTSGTSGTRGTSGTSGTTPALSIELMAAGGWPSTTNGTAPGALSSTTNGQNFYLVSFQDLSGQDPSVEYYEWTIKVPCNITLSNATAQFTWLAKTASTNSVVWAIQAVAYQDADNSDAAWSTAVTVTDANTGNGQINISAVTGAFTPAGFVAGGVNLIQVRVYRDCDNASDNLASIARFISVTLNVSQTTCS
jgi:hypothetical protein